MHAKAPGSVIWEDEDIDRIERAQLALLLHKTPGEIDEMPLQDVEDVLAIHQANQEIESWRMKARRRG